MQNKYLPLMWGGFTMDFELIGNAADAFASPGASDAAFLQRILLLIGVCRIYE